MTPVRSSLQNTSPTKHELSWRRADRRRTMRKVAKCNWFVIISSFYFQRLHCSSNISTWLSILLSPYTMCIVKLNIAMQIFLHGCMICVQNVPFQTTYSSSARWSSTTSKRTSSLWGAAFFGVKMCYLCLIFRWANISDETWEPRNAIPGFVGQQKLFDDDHEFIDP